MLKQLIVLLCTILPVSCFAYLEQSNHVIGDKNNPTPIKDELFVSVGGIE